MFSLLPTGGTCVTHQISLGSRAESRAPKLQFTGVPTNVLLGFT